VGVGGFFVYKSFRTVMHLGDEPPPQFFNVDQKWNAKQREAEERLARAYWSRAVNLSRMHPYGSRLPDKPSDLFNVDVKAYPSAVESAAAARRRYWRNLQGVWHLPQSWKTSYEWHMDWLFQGTNF
jgi:hypothetical protein